MLQMLLPILGNLLGSVVDRVLPGDNPEISKIKLEMQKELNTALLQLNVEQLKINTAEAANPNRTWPTWRESLGYICVLAVAYHFIIQPFFVFIAGLAHWSVTPPDLELGNLMTILTGMLGIHFVDSKYNSQMGVAPIPQVMQRANSANVAIDYSKGQVVDGVWVPGAK
ncbi:MAG: hypothetical protein IM547_01615 [Chitinophagaceae bacterium]|nr:hypothetical protein [Chitinophagaceae bacterium]